VLVKIARGRLLKFEQKIAFPTGSNGSICKPKFSCTNMLVVIYDVPHIKLALYSITAAYRTSLDNTETLVSNRHVSTAHPLFAKSSSRIFINDSAASFTRFPEAVYITKHGCEIGFDTQVSHAHHEFVSDTSEVFERRVDFKLCYSA
jgi:hypothetical protein